MSIINQQLSKIAKTVATLAIALFATSTQAADESFDASLKLLTPITITETQALDFGETVAGSANTVVVESTDANAAVFTATGEASETATVTIVESNIVLTTGDGQGSSKQITVDNFKIGGDVSGGVMTFSGNPDDIRVGATANIEADDVAGTYTGTATLRIVYN